MSIPVKYSILAWQLVPHTQDNRREWCATTVWSNFYKQFRATRSGSLSVSIIKVLAENNAGYDDKTDATWILITEYGAVVEKHRTGHGEPRWVIEFDSDEDRTMFLLRFS